MLSSALVSARVRFRQCLQHSTRQWVVKASIASGLAVVSQATSLLAVEALSLLAFEALSLLAVETLSLLAVEALSLLAVEALSLSSRGSGRASIS
jgi:hypothetical protein